MSAPTNALLQKLSELKSQADPKDWADYDRLLEVAQHAAATLDECVAEMGNLISPVGKQAARNLKILTIKDDTGNSAKKN